MSAPESDTRKAIDMATSPAAPIDLVKVGHNAIVEIVSFYGALLENKTRTQATEMAQLRMALMQEAAKSARASSELSDAKKKIEQFVAMDVTQDKHAKEQTAKLKRVRKILQGLLVTGEMRNKHKEEIEMFLDDVPEPEPEAENVGLVGSGG